MCSSIKTAEYGLRGPVYLPHPSHFQLLMKPEVKSENHKWSYGGEDCIWVVEPTKMMAFVVCPLRTNVGVY